MKSTIRFRHGIDGSLPAYSLWLACLSSSAALMAAPIGPQAPPQSAAATDSTTVYHIVSDRSELRLLVYRAGLLAAEGHNHVITSQGVSGELHLASATDQSALTLTLPLTSLEVDDPAARAQEGSDFTADVTAADAAATRAHMLGDRMLQAGEFPTITIVSTEVRGELPNVSIDASVTVRSKPYRVTLPATVDIVGNQLTAVGEVTLTHEQLGLTPYSALLNALLVKSEFKARYRLVAASGP